MLQNCLAMFNMLLNRNFVVAYRESMVVPVVIVTFGFAGALVNYSVVMDNSFSNV